MSDGPRGACRHEGTGSFYCKGGNHPQRWGADSEACPVDPGILVISGEQKGRK